MANPFEQDQDAVRFSLRLPRDVARRIDRLVGSYGRTKFIRLAIDEALDRYEDEPGSSGDR